mmetsp:Transcript_927/g.2780  ORF Transcript_927/g.2780 Transcript_927/m.2780 type:complete len:236 (+) Transcript_927:542-1249(+)
MPCAPSSTAVRETPRPALPSTRTRCCSLPVEAMPPHCGRCCRDWWAVAPPPPQAPRRPPQARATPLCCSPREAAAPAACVCCSAHMPTWRRATCTGSARWTWRWKAPASSRKAHTARDGTSRSCGFCWRRARRRRRACRRCTASLPRPRRSAAWCRSPPRCAGLVSTLPPPLAPPMCSAVLPSPPRFAPGGRRRCCSRCDAPSTKGLPRLSGWRKALPLCPPRTSRASLRAPALA